VDDDGASAAAAPAPAVSRQSPEYLQMSLAAAMVLGFRPGTFMRDGYTRCLNLLLTYPEGCAANCAYCGLARDRQGEYADKSFIRVEWPSFNMDEIIAASKRRTEKLERMCISMITHRRAMADTLEILERWRREPELDGIPVSILSNPNTMGREDLIALRDAGAERFTVALDAATKEIFDATRGRGVKSANRWGQYWSVFEESFSVFGRENTGVHLICGMGESEGEMVATMSRARQMGEYGCLQLFAFNPEDGSRLQARERVPLGQFRRVQLARYIIDMGLVGFGDFEFNDKDQIVDFGLPGDELEKMVQSGTPFRTSGCPGKECGVSACNRPFGDGPPTDFSSFPFALTAWDVNNVGKQLRDYDGSICREQLSQATLDEIERVSMHPCRG